MTNPPLLNRKVRFGFGSAILILLIVGGLSYRGLIVSNESDQWVSHTNEVLAELQELLFTVERTESTARAFAMTGKESYVESFQAEALEAEQYRVRIGSLTADNASQQRRLPHLKSLADQKIQCGETIIGFRRTQGLEVAAAAVRGGPGERIMNEYRTAIGEMRDEELRLLVQRNTDAKSRLIKSKLVLILGNILCLLIAGAAAWSVQRASVRRALAEAALRETEESLFEERERAQITLRSIGDAVASTDIAGNITFLNFVAERMTGWPVHEALGRPMPEVFRILDGVSREVIANPMTAAVEQNATLHLPANCILVRRDGFETPIDDSVAPIHNLEGQPSGAVIVFRDVSAERANALRMTHLAQHDFLTGLPNRMLFNDRVSHAISLAPRHKNKVAVLFLDLDSFKHINDSLGHRIGDKLLQSVAKRLLDCVRNSDTVSRQGGDEFVVLISELEDPSNAAVTARRMLEAVSDAHSIEQRDLHVTTSIGVSIYPEDGLDAETLIKNADTAMYQAKEHGRQGIQFFKPL
jgi:diguanylate cyclase (GGDEF)-like protein/PAS domain S-box-containing protein